MIRSFIINNYIAKEFLKVILNMCLAFFSLGFVINLFEEINYFKDYDVGITVPIGLTLLFIPSLVYNMFPFIMLLSGIWFFLKIKKNEEITAMKVSGMSNFSVILVPCILSVIIGVFMITTINPITSLMVKKYEASKGSYDIEKDYLAALTVNGIWIKEKNFRKNFIIKAQNLENQNLIDVTIYEFDNKHNFVKRIEAETADISSLNWTLKDVQIVYEDGKKSNKIINEYSYQSMYDIQKITSLYSNLDTISFWNMKNEIALLDKRGYSTREVRTKLHQSLAFPLFLLSMVLLSGVFTLGIRFKENNWTYIFLAIITSVLVFYFNEFSAALGNTEKLPIEISVWMPIVIIFTFGTAGLIHANQK